MASKINNLEDLVMDNLPDIADLFIEIANSDQLTAEIAWSVRDMIEEQYKYLQLKLVEVEYMADKLK